jgi:hypothetical protein
MSLQTLYHFLLVLLAYFQTIGREQVKVCGGFVFLLPECFDHGNSFDTQDR